jgi:hypothetical protein
MVIKQLPYFEAMFNFCENHNLEIIDIGETIHELFPTNYQKFQFKHLELLVQLLYGKTIKSKEIENMELEELEMIFGLADCWGLKHPMINTLIEHYEFRNKFSRYHACVDIDLKDFERWDMDLYVSDHYIVMYYFWNNGWTIHPANMQYFDKQTQEWVTGECCENKICVEFDDQKIFVPFVDKIDQEIRFSPCYTSWTKDEYSNIERFTHQVKNDRTEGFAVRIADN